MKTALITLTLLLTASLFLTPARAADHPNIVLILADDYGYGSANCYGADKKLISTPSIDRLAREGRKFTDANTSSSVCSPTRYSVMTGRYCWRTSLASGVLSTFSPLHIEPGRLTMASMLKKNGYQTAAIGKWHLGYGKADDTLKWRTDYTAELTPGPLDIGFDYHFGVPSNHGDLTGVFVENRFVYGLRKGHLPAGMTLPGPQPDDDNFKTSYTAEDTENGRATVLDLDAPRRVNEQVMPLLTRKATDWIAKQKKEVPFFLYFTPVAVHNPVTPEKDLAGKSAAGKYGDWISELDRSVGRILDALDQAGLTKDTLVIFTSDNGGVFKPARADTPQSQAYQAGLRVNGILRGGKHDVWEGGFKVPFVVRWPDKVLAGSVSNDMISLADLLATTAAVIGQKLPPASQAAEDSQNQLPVLMGTKDQTPVRSDMIVHSSDGVFAIRKGPWKWIEGVPVADTAAAARKVHAKEFMPQLYNVKDDPNETTDLAAKHPEVVAELTALLGRYREGGYSRELPPVVQPSIKVVTELPTLTGSTLMEESFNVLPSSPLATTQGDWKIAEGALWGAQKKGDKVPATLRVPVTFTNASIQLDVSLRPGVRHSMRIHTADSKSSFRVVISAGSLEIAKNADVPGGKPEVLARQKLELKADEWNTLRVSIRGEELTAQIAGVTAKAQNAVFGQPKGLINLLIFDGEAGFRALKVVN